MVAMLEQTALSSTGQSTCCTQSSQAEGGVGRSMRLLALDTSSIRVRGSQLPHLTSTASKVSAIALRINPQARA